MLSVPKRTCFLLWQQWDPLPESILRTGQQDQSSGPWMYGKETFRTWELKITKLGSSQTPPCNQGIGSVLRLGCSEGRVNGDDVVKNLQGSGSLWANALLQTWPAEGLCRAPQGGVGACCSAHWRLCSVLVLIHNPNRQVYRPWVLQLLDRAGNGYMTLLQPKAVSHHKFLLAIVGWVWSQDLNGGFCFLWDR